MFLELVKHQKSANQWTTIHPSNAFSNKQNHALDPNMRPPLAYERSQWKITLRKDPNILAKKGPSTTLHLGSAQLYYSLQDNQQLFNLGKIEKLINKSHKNKWGQ